MTTYTEGLQDALWKLADDFDTTEDTSLITDFLNNHDSFRSFGEGIIAIINRTSNDQIDNDQVIAYLEKCCNDNGVNLSEIASKNTLKNWFEKDMRPKKGETSRDAMFALSFALKLSIEDTALLFHEVYLDRAFNFRSAEEIVYYYCKMNNKHWADAKRLIASAQAGNADKSDTTKYTVAIKADVENVENEQQLLTFLQEHGHNLDKDSVTAYEVFHKYLAQAKTVAASEIKQIEYEELFVDKWKNNEEISNNLLFEIITGRSITGVQGTKTIFNNVDLPKEILNRFPEAGSFGKSNMGSEELRKTIVLLFSYCIWCTQRKNEEPIDFDDYRMALNLIMQKCGFADLYFGNPYDWLFLYCAQSYTPLDTFRDVLAEAFGD